jgi:hypothetical protein
MGNYPKYVSSLKGSYSTELMLAGMPFLLQFRNSTGISRDFQQRILRRDQDGVVE